MNSDQKPKMISVKCKACGTKTFFEVFILKDKTFRKGYCKHCGAEVKLPPLFSVKSENKKGQNNVH